MTLKLRRAQRKHKILLLKQNEIVEPTKLLDLVKGTPTTASVALRTVGTKGERLRAWNVLSWSEEVEGTGQCKKLTRRCDNGGWAGRFRVNVIDCLKVRIIETLILAEGW